MSIIKENFTESDIEKIEKLYLELINKYQIALADSICRPHGVIPDSAKNLVTAEMVMMANVRLRNQVNNV